MMKITIWADFVCPFCMIGQSHLDQALETFEHKDDVEIEYMSFLLMPEAQYDPKKSYAHTLSSLKRMQLAQTHGVLSHAEQMANRAGLGSDFADAKLRSRLSAHRVFQNAKEEGHGFE